MRIPAVYICAIAALTACGGDTPAADSPVDATPKRDTATLSAAAVAIGEFAIDTVRETTWRSAVTAPARLMLDPENLETIGSITEGRISHVLVRVGDRVRANQVLVMIHSHEIMDARSALAQADAHVASAAIERETAVAAADRAHRLFAGKAMSRAEVERAEAAQAVAIARHTGALAEREHAEALVTHLVGEGPTPADADQHDVLIRTPIAGVVISRDAQPGTVVLPGDALVTIGDPGQLLLQMRLSEQAARSVRLGATVRYALTDNPAQRFDAVVSRIAPTIDTVTRTVEVRATLRGKGDGARAEAFAQAEILSPDATTATVVPLAAIQVLEGDTVVIATEQRGDGMFIESVPVRVGRTTLDQVEIRSGIAAGKTILVKSAAIAKAELIKRRTGGAVE